MNYLTDQNSSFYSNPTKNIIYVLPLGDFPPISSPDLSIVQYFTACYFHPLKVVFLTPVKEIDRTDEHLTFQVQSGKESSALRTYKVKIEYKAEKIMFLTGDVKDVLLKEKIHLQNRKYPIDRSPNHLLTRVIPVYSNR
jgi:hypothetical protein